MADESDGVDEAWQQIDPDAARAADRIRDEVRTRYGVDVEAPGDDPTAVRDALQRRGLTQEGATDQRSTAAREQVEAALLLAESDRADRAQDTAAEPERAAGEDLYDIAGRRQGVAASLEGVASSEAIEARVLADSAQGRPAHEAVAHAPGKAPKMRRARTTGARMQQPRELRPLSAAGTTKGGDQVPTARLRAQGPVLQAVTTAGSDGSGPRGAS